MPRLAAAEIEVEGGFAVALLPPPPLMLLLPAKASARARYAHTATFPFLCAPRRASSRDVIVCARCSSPLPTDDDEEEDADEGWE